MEFNGGTDMRTGVTMTALAGVGLVVGFAALQQGGRTLTAALGGTGGASGSAEVRASLGQEEVCYELSLTNVDGATAAHVHLGGAGSSGPAVITFAVPSGGSSKGCVNVNRALVRDLIEAPGDYYVDVHTAAAPKGAVRGQLKK